MTQYRYAPLPLREMIKKALFANWQTALALAAVAAAVVTGYYFVYPIRALMERVALFRESYGLRFSMVSTGVFGGLIPLFLEQLRSRPSHPLKPATLIFFPSLWVFKGIEFDLLYRAQAFLFGDSADPAVVVAKTVVDMLIYVPLWAIPSVVIAYLWLDHGFDAGRTLESLGSRWYRRRVLPVLMVNWMVWVPAVIVIYSLPLPLQLPVQNIFLLLFAIILLCITASSEISGCSS